MYCTIVIDFVQPFVSEGIMAALEQNGKWCQRSKSAPFVDKIYVKQLVVGSTIWQGIGGTNNQKSTH